MQTVAGCVILGLEPDVDVNRQSTMLAGRNLRSCCIVHDVYMKEVFSSRTQSVFWTESIACVDVCQSKT